MKKKLLIFVALIVSVLSLSACGKTKINIADYVIEERNQLFTGQDSLYSATLSSGLREENYSLDGIVGNMIDFAVVTFMRLDSNPLANDTYRYNVTINEQNYTGTLEKSPYDNSYAIDLGVAVPADASVNVQITFTGYAFNQDLENTSVNFAVDKTTALNIANQTLEEEIKNITSDKNNKIEVVMKILKDYSNSELKTYYWYVGIIATNGETLGVLIDANTGNIIAKKV
ncbi:MAG: hypothetical protein IKM43_02070 [Clostridia bacterium]|nr:hypothetical protein [Clostridia bacterium]